MNKKPHALIIDDEPDLRELLEITLGRMNMEASSCGTVAEAKEALKHHTYEICLTDMCLPDGNGLAIVDFIQEHMPELPVAVITAHGTMETAIQALKKGAFDFVNKPIELDVLRLLVHTALKLSDVPSQESHIKACLLGESNIMKELLEKIRKLARSQAPVYIHGPSGSGKELVARLIHDLSARNRKAFVPINCGAIPRELMESEFFGHKKGSFTGATQDKQGLFSAAEGGTLFLDEIGELPLDMQVKLLRAIQEKSIRPVGATVEQRVDVRILSATHQDLRQLVELEKFRDDLFYRINVIEVNVPGLHDHPEDLPILIDHFLERLSERNQCPPPKLAKTALNALYAYPFPGNVRELENILERALTMCENQIIEVEDLQLPDAAKVSQQEDKSSDQAFNVGETSLATYMDDVERQAIQGALTETQGNKTAAAKLLGISLKTLRYRMRKLGLES